MKGIRLPYKLVLGLDEGNTVTVSASRRQNRGNKVGLSASRRQNRGNKVGLSASRRQNRGNKVGLSASRHQNRGNKVGLLASRHQNRGNKVGLSASRHQNRGNKVTLLASRHPIYSQFEKVIWAKARCIIFFLAGLKPSPIQSVISNQPYLQAEKKLIDLMKPQKCYAEGKTYYLKLITYYSNR